MSPTPPTGANAMPVEDAVGNDAAGLSGRTVVNHASASADTSPPAPWLGPPLLLVATVDDATLVLDYYLPLDETSTPPTNAFSVYVGSRNARTPTTVVVRGSDVTLTLAAPVTAGAEVTVSYSVPEGEGAMPIQDPDGHPADAFRHLRVTNYTGAPDAPQDLTADPDDQQVALSWSAPDDTGDGPILYYQYRLDDYQGFVPDWPRWDPDWDDDRRLDPDATGQTLPRLCNGARLVYELRAVNVVGPGPPARGAAELGHLRHQQW